MIRTDAAVAEIRHRHKLTNLLHSALLLGGMACLLALCGWVVAAGEGVFWAFAAGALCLLFSPRYPHVWCSACLAPALSSSSWV